MGKLEKVIVLTVLFVTAVVLVVSMMVDDPLDTTRLAGTPDAGVRAAPTAPPEVVASPAPKAAPATATGTAPSTLLHTEANPTQPTPAPAAETPAPAPAPTASAVPPGSLLKTAEGLAPSFSDDMRFYTWRDGDTFRALATRYYGDAARVTLLRRVNEDRFDVTPGERVLIPVFDLDAPRAGAAGERPADDGSVAGPASKPVAAPVAAGGGRVHVVQEGESLWKIAKAELGTGSRWKEIFDANRDVLPDPEALHKGMKLRIP